MRNKRRKNFFVLIIICLMAIIPLFIIISHNKEQYSNSSSIIYETYIVKSGDTLWGIAKQHLENKEEDPRRLIYEIRKFNGITPVIQIGQEILIPIRK